MGGTAPPRQVRSPLRRSRLLAASLALCVLTRPFVVRFSRRGGGGYVCVTRAAAVIVPSSGSESPRRFPSRQNGPLVWLGVFFACDAARAVVWVGARTVRCAAGLLCCRHGGDCGLGMAAVAAAKPTAASTASGVGVAWARWAPRPTRRGCLATLYEAVRHTQLVGLQRAVWYSRPVGRSQGACDCRE